MQSILDPRAEAQISADLIEARRAVRAADRAPHDVEAIRLAHAGMVRVMAKALRECAIVAGSVKEEDLRALGFTPGEITTFGLEARTRAARDDTRTIRRAA